MGEKQTLILHRQYGAQGTNGALRFQGELICYTIELPWRNNAIGSSCIPEGKYKLKKKQYPKLGEQIGLPHVLGREAILIHPANVAWRELQGCIAPVSQLTAPGEGTESRKALAKLKACVYCFWDMGDEVWLHIRSGKTVGSNN